MARHSPAPCPQRGIGAPGIVRARALRVGRARVAAAGRPRLGHRPRLTRGVRPRAGSTTEHNRRRPQRQVATASPCAVRTRVATQTWPARASSRNRSRGSRPRSRLLRDALTRAAKEAHVRPPQRMYRILATLAALSLLTVATIACSGDDDGRASSVATAAAGVEARRSSGSAGRATAVAAAATAAPLAAAVAEPPRRAEPPETTFRNYGADAVRRYLHGRRLHLQPRHPTAPRTSSP